LPVHQRVYRKCEAAQQKGRRRCRVTETRIVRSASAEAHEAYTRAPSITEISTSLPQSLSARSNTGAWPKYRREEKKDENSKRYAAPSGTRQQSVKVRVTAQSQSVILQTVSALGSCSPHSCSPEVAESALPWQLPPAARRRPARHGSEPRRSPQACRPWRFDVSSGGTLLRVRAALEEKAQGGRFVRTVRRFGYAWTHCLSIGSGHPSNTVAT
jgi:hypothetical protein